MRTLLVTLIVAFLLSCNNDKKKAFSYSIENKIDSLIEINPTVLRALTNSYDFTPYVVGGGVGPDTLHPHLQDTIIILKNNRTERLNTNLIYGGRTILLDSNKICSLSHVFDSKHQVMRYFMDLRLLDGNNGRVNFEVVARQWVPQFVKPEKYCKEAFEEELLGRFTITK